MFARDRWDPDRMMDGWDGDGWYGGMHDGGGWVMLVVVLLLVAVLVATLVVVLRGTATGPSGTLPPAPPPGPPRSGARELLDLRLARGEISPEEYTSLRDVLTG